MTITQDVAAIGANLDSTLELRTATGTIIASANPSTSYGATITASLAAGDYTIVTASAGQYGSVGQYTVTVTTSTAPANQAPQAADATFSVAENAAVGTPVGTVTATDADSPAQTLAYAITAGNNAGVFAINSATGQITVANNSGLNYEATSKYTLTVEVTDNGTPNLSDTATITINLADVNEAPILADATFSVAENAAVGTPVGTVAASDPDRPAQTLTYAITAGNNSGAFAINSASGQITVANNSALDYETISQYVLTVQVADDGTPSLSDTATVTINLADANDAPVLGDATFALPEYAAVGTLVGTVTATDPDRPAQTLTYAITAGNASGLFAIHSATGQITLADNSTLDYETISQYVLTVRVADNGTPSLSDTAAVTINVTPMNRPPQIVTVGEQWAVKGEELSFVVSAFDPDVPQQTLLYSLEPGAPAGAAIDPVTGRFSWTPASSAEARSYALDIRVTDSGTPPLADVVKMAINVAEPLGAADSRSLLDVPAAESHWYALSTVRAGFLTAEAAYAGTGSVSMAIYDDQGQPLASSTGRAGLARIDIPAAAGEAFYVKVATTASAVDLSLANLVSQVGGTVAVFGTGADDAFAFDASGQRISINGLVYQFTAAEATNVTFDGGPGNNAATLKGTAGGETATLYPGRADLLGAGFEVHVVNTASITFDGSGGADQAYLNDSDGNDTFVARLGDCVLSGVSSAGIGYSSRVMNVATVNASGKTGGRDVAEFHEFAGSTFVRRGSFANLSGSGVFYEGKFFEETLLVPLAASDGTGGLGGKTKTPPAKSQTLTAAEIALIDQAIVEGAPGAANPLDRGGEAACPPGLLPAATARVFAEFGRSA
ncbi:MAG: cadherin domain-containing protein [Thermoguttaceae bacterium]